MNTALNSLLQAARKSSGKEYMKSIISDKKGKPQKLEKRQASSSEESSNDDNEVAKKTSSMQTKTKLKSLDYGGQNSYEKQSAKFSPKKKHVSDDHSGSDEGGHYEVSAVVTKQKKKLNNSSEMGRVPWRDNSDEDDYEETSMKKHESSKKKSHQFSNPKQNDEESRSIQKHKRKKSIEFDDEFPQSHTQKKRKKQKDDTNNCEVTLAHSAQNNNITKVKEQNRPLQKLFTNKNTALYLLKLPSDVDPNDLLGKTISLNGNSKVRLQNKEKLDISLKEENSNGCQVLAPLSYHIGQIEAILHGKRHVRRKPEVLDPVVKSFDMEQDVKERHPIFGSSFTEEMEVDESVAEKLENPVKMKKKHKKDKEKLQEENETYQIDEFAIENDLGVVKKKKKKKKKEHDEIIESNILTLDTDLEGAFKKKKKKKKEKRRESENEEHDSGEDDLDVFAILSQAKQKVLGKN